MPSIFNSLGSNYDSSSGAYGLILNKPNAPQTLTDIIVQRYSMPHVTLCYKGREAIALGIKQLGLSEGLFIAINGYTCYAVYQAIVAANMKPYYLDIEKDQLNFTPKALQQALEDEPRIAAVMIQNTLGLPADVGAINKLCKEHSIPLIEDMAHCAGLMYDSGVEAGTVGQVAAFSFSQDKIVDAVCGGAVITRDVSEQPQVRPSIWVRIVTRMYPWIIGFIRHTHSWGLGKVVLRIVKVLHLLPGPMSGNAAPARRLPNWNANLVVKCFKNLDKNIKHRQAIATIYREYLPAYVQFRHTDGSVYLRFPLKVEEASDLVVYLKKYGINLGTRWYDAPVAPKWLHAKTDYQQGQCPNAEWMSQRMINLPTHAHISEKDAKYIAERIGQWLKL